MADYSFSPQFANLSGLQPLPALDVTRGAALQFQPLQAIQVQSSRPELVAEGIAGAVSNIAKGALSGITAKYEKKEEKDKETRKFAQELLLEEAKQKTKNKQFLDELKLKVASEHGLEADVDERMAALEEAAQRLGMVNPSGNTPAKKPTPKPSIDSEADTSSDTYGNRELSPTDAVFVPTGTPKDGSLRIDAKTPLPETEPAPPIPVPSAAVVPPSDEISIPEPDIMPSVQRVSTQGTQPPALTGLQVQPVAAAAQTPALAGMEAPVDKWWLQNQPKEVTQPRKTDDIVFEPSQQSVAEQAAIDLSKSSDYNYLVTAEKDSRNRWVLKQQDNSANVAKLAADAERLGIDKQKLIIDQANAQIQAKKAEDERIKNETEKLKADKAAFNTLKNSVNNESVKLFQIDQAIDEIESDPSIVGIMTDYYLGKEKMPLSPITYKEAAMIAEKLGYKDIAEKAQKVKNISNRIASIGSNIGWSIFREMKTLSPTGTAGVGSLTEGERQSLEQTQGPLDITSSPDLILETLYNLKNGTTKTIVNASKEIKQIDPAFKMPIMSPLRITKSDKDLYNKIQQAAEKATDKAKKTENYLNAMQKKEMLENQAIRIKEFNQMLAEMQAL
jgi:hypothetical protein